MVDVTPTPAVPRFMSRADALLSRAGLRSQAARDWALGVAVAVLAAGGTVLLIELAGDVELHAMTTGQVVGVAVLLGLQGLALGIRRSATVACLWAVLALQLAVLPLVPAGTSVWGPAVLVAGYSVGAHVETGRASRVMRAAVVIMLVAGFALAATIPALASAWSSGRETTDWPGASELGLLALNHVGSTAFALLTPFLLGVYIATRRAHIELMRERAEDAIFAQQVRADAAIAAERTRMARELHDIAAHHLSGMVVQAAAVERLVDRDPEAAKAGAGWIRMQGRETLANLRSVVGMLRGSGVEGPAGLTDGGAPVPGLSVADELVENARALGDTIEVSRAGEERPLSPIADVAAYRVLQEALSNARLHAPGTPVRVRMLHAAECFELAVTNAATEHPPAPAAREGLGLLGMRERAQLCGGTLDAGPTPDGGWRVVLVLPRDGEEAQ